MFHHEESSEKSQFPHFLTIPPILINLPFLAKIFIPPPAPTFTLVLKKSNPVALTTFLISDVYDVYKCDI